MKDFFDTKTAVGWACYHQNNKRHGEKKNIVEHNLSFDIKKRVTTPLKHHVRTAKTRITQNEG